MAQNDKPPPHTPARGLPGPSLSINYFIARRVTADTHGLTFRLQGIRPLFFPGVPVDPLLVSMFQYSVGRPSNQKSKGPDQISRVIRSIQLLGK